MRIHDTLKKILGTYDTKDKRGRKLTQYKIHFQGWSSSWDRKVNADFVLKDTEENRQLQRDLAEKAQLQINAFLYRKERSINKKKQIKSLVPSDDGTTAAGGNTTNADLQPSPHFRARGSSEDNFSSSSTLERQEDCSMKDECESESCCSSVESFPEEERVLLRISERLRQYLEYDHDMIVKYCKQHALPARIPVVAILENFVKHSVIKLVFSATQVESTRRRTTQQRTNKKEHEFDKLVATVSLLKEVADGLRIYFDFTIADYLLYKEEKEYALSYLSEDSLKNFTYVEIPGLTPDFLNPTKNEIDTSGAGVENFNEIPSTEPVSSTPVINEEPQKRKSRLHRSDDCEMTLESCLENCLSSIASTSSGASTPLHSAVGGSGGPSGIHGLKSLQPIALNIPPQTKEFLQSVLSWHLLPTNAPPAPSMIFGAPHLARLIVKLPEFLNASSMSDDKLKVLLQHLDTFVNYLEARKEWFNEDNYARSNTTRKRASSSENVKPNMCTESVKSTLESNASTQAADTIETISTATTPTAATTTATTATTAAAVIAT
ncbi:protein male-specific lethal-3 isoform X2 [Eurosta solidaginis]|uniref:protein male-specific lethal-3 isoform X2 n=1 Tax=Eurosta solidaginis TaxID=178769 RepID=UPI0035309AF0